MGDPHWGPQGSQKGARGGKMENHYAWMGKAEAKSESLKRKA